MLEDGFKLKNGFTYHNVDQNSELWFDMRAGKLTSSKLGIVMANFGKSFGEPAKKYAKVIAVEQIRKAPVASSFSNDHMERGHEQEPLARTLYEQETFSTVDNGGFFCSDEVGCSPDGLIMDDGVNEIKCVIANIHYDNVKRQKIDPAYNWQCIGNLKFTERDWIDFISYCADYPEGKQLFVHRGRKEEFTEQFEMIDQRIDEFMSLVRANKETIINSSYFNQ